MGVFNPFGRGLNHRCVASAAGVTLCAIKKQSSGGRSVKRIHFTGEDLARTRVATTNGVAAETFDSVKLLRDRDRSLGFHHWRTSVSGRLGEQARPLVALMPARGPMVDMASLAGDATCIAEATDQLRSILERSLHPCHGQRPSLPAAAPAPTALRPRISPALAHPCAIPPRRRGRLGDVERLQLTFADVIASDHRHGGKLAIERRAVALATEALNLQNSGSATQRVRNNLYACAASFRSSAMWAAKRPVG